MRKRSKEPATARRTVLVVDDDADFQWVLREMLSGAFDVLGLANGEGLLDQLPQIRPDLVILDIRLPGPDGIELCRKIRGDGRFASLPVLFLTSSDADRDFVRNLEAGGSAYLTKPVTQSRLLHTVRGLLPV